MNEASALLAFAAEAFTEGVEVDESEPPPEGGESSESSSEGGVSREIIKPFHNSPFAGNLVAFAGTSAVAPMATNEKISAPKFLGASPKKITLLKLFLPPRLNKSNPANAPTPIVLTPEGIDMEVKLLALKNAHASISVSRESSPNKTVRSDKEFSNAESPIKVTDEGIEIEERTLVLKKVSRSIRVTPKGIEIDVRLRASAKANAPISVSSEFSPKFTVSRFLASWNALAAIEVTDEGMVTDSMPSVEKALVSILVTLLPIFTVPEQALPFVRTVPTTT